MCDGTENITRLKDPEVKAAAENERKRKKAAAGKNSTILTGAKSLETISLTGGS